MKLITKKIKDRLLANGLDLDRDHTPVVKFFNPAGVGTWLITSMDPEDPDILFGLADLGVGCPELGSVRLSELESIRTAFGLRIERDLYFRAKAPLSAYTQAASDAGIIVDSLS